MEVVWTTFVPHGVALDAISRFRYDFGINFDVIFNDFYVIFASSLHTLLEYGFSVGFSRFFIGF